MAIRFGRRHAALFAALALGCESAQRAGETAAFRLNPFGTTEVGVVETAAHGPYFFVRVHGRKLNLRFAVPRSEICARVLGPEASVRYEKAGSFGRFSREGETCEAVGSLSPGAWRDRQPRRRDSFAPRSTARYTVVYRDEEYIFLRGRFALAALVGVPASADTVAVVPENEACREVAARREASLEFRPVGGDPLRLLAGRAPCAVAGFAMPVEGLPER